MNQLQGQQEPKPVGQQVVQPPNMAGIAVTASKVSIFFMIVCLLRKQSGITAWVAPSDYPIQTLNGRGSGEWARTGRSSRQVEQLYIALCDVQTQPLIFSNNPPAGMLNRRHSSFIFPSVLQAMW
ncbi:MAG: hypothetical protein WD738_07000 [Pirellulales bacterium]